MIERNRRASRVAFGRIVRQARVALNLSVQSLAKHVGVSPQFVAQIERGHSGPSRDTACAIATALTGALAMSRRVQRAAQQILCIDFSDDDRASIRELVDRTQRGTLSYQESGALDTYCHTALLLQFLRAGAVRANVPITTETASSQGVAGPAKDNRVALSAPTPPPMLIGWNGDLPFSQEEAVVVEGAPENEPRNAAAAFDLHCLGSLALAPLPADRGRSSRAPSSGVVVRAKPHTTTSSAPSTPARVDVPPPLPPPPVPPKRSPLIRSSVLAAAALFFLAIVSYGLATVAFPPVLSATPFMARVQVTNDPLEPPEAREPMPRPLVVTPRPAQRATRTMRAQKRPLCTVIACGREADE